MGERIGKYEILKTLGRGATATVYLARDPDAQCEVALKVVTLSGGSQAMSRRLQKLFQTESAVARRLDHPNIVKVFDAVVESDRAYMALEYVKGSPLDEYVRVDQLLSSDRVIDIVFKCALALDHAHRQGIVHRDIKPANVLIDDKGNPKITDFGLALFLQKNAATDSTFVMGVGSPAYMSPEQVKDYPLGPKTDLYSLGVMLFQLLTGRLPFRGSNPAALIYKIINAETPQVTALNPRLPKALDTVIGKALAKDLWSRYASGAEFGKDLTAARYELVDDSADAADHDNFRRLRDLRFFDDFEDIEIWETLRVSSWRELPAKVTLMQEGATDRRFGLLMRGMVEVSIGGKSVARLGAGEVIGEMAYLSPKEPIRRASVVSLEEVSFLEINASALDLASEEVQKRFRNALIGVLLARLAAANQVLAAHGYEAVLGSAVPAAGAARVDLPPIDFGRPD